MKLSIVLSSKWLKLEVLRFGAEEVGYSHFEDILKTQEKDEGTKVLWFVWIST